MNFNEIVQHLKGSGHTDAPALLKTVQHAFEEFNNGLIEQIDLDRLKIKIVKENPWINEPSDLERLQADLERLQSENKLLRAALDDAIMQMESSIPSTKRRGIIPLLFLEGKIEQYKNILNKEI